MHIGYVGLGKMGKNMVLRLLEGKIEVIAWNRSPQPLEEVVQAGASKSESIEQLVDALPTPKIIWLMLPAGEPTEDMLKILKNKLKSGDIVIDGANSFYRDSQRHSQELADSGIVFMDVGVSGGLDGARNGACLMIGGDKSAFDNLKSLWEVVAAPNAFAYLGSAGAGHFAKMIHNGIEYGMMQAIAEGAAVLEKSEFNYDLAEVFRIYNNQSVISSRLIGWAKDAVSEDPKLTNISSHIEHTGEGEWTIKTARDMNLSIPVIETSFQVRVDSETTPDNFRNRMVSALRGKFGHHKVQNATDGSIQDRLSAANNKLAPTGPQEPGS